MAVPDLKLSDTLSAEWDEGAGLIYIIRLQSESEKHTGAEPWRHVFSPDEVNKLAAWIAAHGLT